MKRQYLVYCSFPYSDDPERRTEQINSTCKEVYQAAHAKDNDLILLIPHNIFDRVFNFPVGNSNEWMCPCELTLIDICDAVAYDPCFSSPGVVWEKAYACHVGKPLLTYEELKAGKRPIINRRNED